MEKKHKPQAKSAALTLTLLASLSCPVVLLLSPLFSLMGPSLLFSKVGFERSPQEQSRSEREDKTEFHIRH